MTDELKAWSEEQAYERAKAEYLKKLDKMRAKIAEKIVIRPALNHSRTERDRNDAFLEVLDTIDKYMAESKVEE